ncbi:MAG: outer membrane protein assembly factor BamC [Crocinitomicaceae bacterium]|jgi:outer membrane protein assembly factor BamC
MELDQIKKLECSMRLVVLMVMAYAVTGCSWLIHDRSNDYLDIQIQPNIVVPSEVALVTLSPRLAIPDVRAKILPEEFVVPRPKPLVLDGNQESDQPLASENAVKLDVELVKDGNGSPILRLNVTYARAWSEIGEALQQTQITLVDLNRSIGTYYIEVVDTLAEVEPTGFWAGLYGSEPEIVKKSLEIKVNRARSGVYVAIHIDQDNLAADADANALLLSLQKKLEETEQDLL